MTSLENIERFGEFEAARQYNESEIEANSTATVDTFRGLIHPSSDWVDHATVTRGFISSGKDAIGEALLRQARFLSRQRLFEHGGSSGSPVFVSSTNFILGLHHPRINHTVEQAIECAKILGLENIAKRLSELSVLPLDEDHLPISPESASNFIRYCFLRGKRNELPLITATPSGELDAIWKGPRGQKITLRFFNNDTIWLAYKLEASRGSLEANVNDLLKPNFQFKIPQWA